MVRNYSVKNFLCWRISNFDDKDDNDVHSSQQNFSSLCCWETRSWPEDMDLPPSSRQESKNFLHLTKTPKVRFHFCQSDVPDQEWPVRSKTVHAWLLLLVFLVLAGMWCVSRPVRVIVFMLWCPFIHRFARRSDTLFVMFKALWLKSLSYLFATCIS